MGEATKIQWCDHTFNPWWGCSKVHTGCTHCYAEAFSKRTGRAQWGDAGTRMRTGYKNWREPIKWNAAAEKSGERARVFCASMADVFEDWTGTIHDFQGNALQVSNCKQGLKYAHGQSLACRLATLDDLRRDLFELIDKTPWLDWQLLTKRPENIQRMWPISRGTETDTVWSYRDNVWLGTSVSNQETTDGIDPLLKCRDLAPVLFLSVEPLVGRLDLGLRNWPDSQRVDWVIVGGESGAGARPCDVGDVQFIVEDCQQAGVPVFVKQLGGCVVEDEVAWRERSAKGSTRLLDHRGGKLPASIVRWAMNDPKGDAMADWPERLRVRQFPREATP